jgi:ATP-dependent protease HslVU (ClpYQ) peptidase subunit
LSCVVAIKQGNKVWMGADSRAANDFVHTLSPASSKIFRCGPMLIGATGSPRPQHIIRHVFQPQEYDGKTDPLDYLIAKFALPLRELLKDHGALFDDDGPADQQIGDRTSAWMLIGLAGRIFNFESCFQVLEYQEDYAATGSGSPIALGVLYATPATMNPEKRIRLSLEAAAYYDCGNVGPPFIIESIEHEDANSLMMKAWQTTYDSHRKKCKKKVHSRCTP